jgi:hypothetical protein
MHDYFAPHAEHSAYRERGQHPTIANAFAGESAQKKSRPRLGPDYYLINRKSEAELDFIHACKSRQAKTWGRQEAQFQVCEDATMPTTAFTIRDAMEEATCERCRCPLLIGDRAYQTDLGLVYCSGPVPR